MNKKIFGIRVGTILTVVLALIAAFLTWVVAKSANLQTAFAFLPKWN